MCGAGPHCKAGLWLAVASTALFACLCLVEGLTTPMRATADDASGKDTVPWREFWIGADLTEETWLVYSGATLSPFSHIHDDGLRIRFSTGYGQYDYSGERTFCDPALCDPRLGRRPVNRSINFEAVTQYAELLIGYLKRFGDLTAKVFVGAAYLDHQIGPRDPVNQVQGAAWGIKSGVELWLNMGANAWGSLDLNYTTAHDTFAARSRFGYRVLPTVSLGPEFGVNGHFKSHRDGDLQYARGRAGAFARYEWAGGEVSASGGVTANIDEDITPYLTVNWMTRY